ncbi:LysM peptidoglycan-binding domain-containing M23 family metallopeptidase [Meiothermus cerbereus]|uniref:LysM peptidoglycan-binding domain-containing M23 family metallopeptidase n=1 Tax=Meiothermus cerbereus TaxID=65552 RepID=UPI003EEA5A7A
MRYGIFTFVTLCSLAFAQATHIVQPGETLYRIARQYNTTVEALQVLNHISDPTQLRVGQVLRVSGQPNTALNRRTQAPAPIKALEWPRQTVQGYLAVIRITAPEPVQGEVRFLNNTYPIQQNRVLLPVPALQAPGVYPALLRVGQDVVRLEVRVVAGSFGRFVLQLPPDRRALLVPERLRAERLQVVGSCDFNRPQQWRGPFRKPIQTNRITDPFGTRRSYDQGRTYSYHEGLDYGVPEGTPVYAPAPGVVGLAETLFVRGGAVTLDHGLGVCSGYWHLSRIVVKPGQIVRAGDLLGYSGNTGLSNGPHLHFEIRVRGIPTNPAPWFLSVP